MSKENTKLDSVLWVMASKRALHFWHSFIPQRLMISAKSPLRCLLGHALLMLSPCGSSSSRMVKEALDNKRCPNSRFTPWRPHRCVTLSTWQNWWTYIRTRDSQTGNTIDTPCKMQIAYVPLLKCVFFIFSSNQSDPVLADGVPAVRELHKLEFEWVSVTFEHLNLMMTRRMRRIKYDHSLQAWSGEWSEGFSYAVRSPAGST